MRIHALIVFFLIFLLGCDQTQRSMLPPQANIIHEKSLISGKEYVYGHSGICGEIEEGGLRVTRALPDSPAEGVVRKGDLIERVWKYPFSTMAAKGMHRSREDFWRTMRLGIKRPASSGTREKFITVYLELPPFPGEVYYFGAAGFHAELHPAHLVVTQVEEGSPAEGQLKIGDKVLAVHKALLKGKVLRQFAAAIDWAESESAGGRLDLTVERKQKEGVEVQRLEMTLALKVFGSYSQSAPYGCRKTDALISQAADRVLAEKKHGRLGVNLLGLLATGEKKYIDYVGEVLKAREKKEKKALDMAKSSTAWAYGYQLLTLCEYYLLTQDKEILPLLKDYALACAEGQDSAGLWNHRGANPAANFGQKHGRLYGYGAINQTSIVLWMGLALAEKCGVENPEVRMAVEKSYALYKNWIGKGAIPYGNHGPNESTNNNNGTSGSVAVAFSLMGDLEGVEYYSKLTAASHPSLLTGHASSFFNPLWSAMGSHLAGPEVASAYFRKTRWLRTITRTPDGDYYEQGQAGVGGLDGLGSAGSALLQLCLGRQAIHITGKGMSQRPWLKGDMATKAVSCGEVKVYEMRTAELLKQLGSSLPQQRLQAAEALAVKNVDVSNDIERFLNEGRREEKLGAATAAALIKNSKLVDALLQRTLDDHEDIWVREKSVMALRSIGKPAQVAIPKLLKLLAEDRAEDPFQDLDRALGYTIASLAPNPYILTLDKKVFYRGVRKLLNHKHMNGRDAGMKMIQAIPKEEFHQIADLTRHIIEDKDLGYTAYQSLGAMSGALKIWARLGIADGVEHALEPLNRATGKGGFKNRMLMDVLPHFGGHAKPILPKLRTMNTKGRFKEPWDVMVKAIEEAPDPEFSISFEEAKKSR
jgi:hypothetical protein